MKLISQTGSCLTTEAWCNTLWWSLVTFSPLLLLRYSSLTELFIPTISLSISDKLKCLLFYACFYIYLWVSVLQASSGQLCCNEECNKCQFVSEDIQQWFGFTIHKQYYLQCHNQPGGGIGSWDLWHFEWSKVIQLNVSSEISITYQQGRAVKSITSCQHLGN